MWRGLTSLAGLEKDRFLLHELRGRHSLERSVLNESKTGDSITKFYGPNACTGCNVKDVLGIWSNRR